MKINLLNSIFSVFILTLLCPFNARSQANPKPKWAQNGVKALNKKRISKDYEFCAFSQVSTDIVRLDKDPFSPLKEYLAEKYEADVNQMVIDSIVSSDVLPVTYKITFPASGKDEKSVVFAQRVDEYTVFENNINNTYDFEFYQLYAVSDRDITPCFDKFEVTRKYNALPVAMSLIPGLGQIYKGQKGKGFGIMGAEVVFIGTIIYGQCYNNYYNREVKKYPENFDSWKSKAHTYRTIRNVGIVLAGATYIYNILDAALSKGAPHVVIKPSVGNTVDMVFSPVITPWSIGAGMTVNF